MEFLRANVFHPILNSSRATDTLKQGVRYTMMRLDRLDAAGKVQYYWSAIGGTEQSAKFARQMKKEGFTRFEEFVKEFRDRFNEEWLQS